MDIKEAIQYLSHNLNQDKKLQQFVELNGFDFQMALVIEDGYRSDTIDKNDGALYLASESEGFDFLFITENTFFCNKLHLPMIEGEWYLSTIFLYSEGTNGYSQYKGDLPYGVSFDMTQLEIHTILEEDIVFSRSNKEGTIVAEEWDYDYFSIYITYNPSTLTPKVVQIDTYSGKFPPKKEGIKVQLPEALCDK